LYAFALQCAQAPVIDHLRQPVDVRALAPVNPPEELQNKFVGLSFESAFLEAYSFVAVVKEKVEAHGLTPLERSTRVIDFGSGWGRISRMLLHSIEPTSLYALDVDPEMTALVNTTLPGVNAMTTQTLPPTALASGAFDGALAFSVFSHLSEAAHVAWAEEFGRLIRPGGFAAITVLDAEFFTTIRRSQHEATKPNPSPFAVSMAKIFPDPDASETAYTEGAFQYAGGGEDGARQDHYYGWAAAPSDFVSQIWGQAGFAVLEWIPSGVLFPQALVILEKATGTVIEAPDASDRTGGLPTDVPFPPQRRTTRAEFTSRVGLLSRLRPGRTPNTTSAGLP